MFHTEQKDIRFIKVHNQALQLGWSCPRDVLQQDKEVPDCLHLGDALCICVFLIPPTG